MKILKVGDHGPEVEALQRALMSQGFFPGVRDGEFGRVTESAVVKFQQTHQGPDGQWLTVDGEAGPATLWALDHPSGAPQASGIAALADAAAQSLLPAMDPGPVRAVLEFAEKKYRANVHEIPDGSNGGDGVDEITKGVRVPWCMMFVQFCLEQALGQNPFGKRNGSCYWTAELAKRQGWWWPRIVGDGLFRIAPGDIMIFLHGTARGWRPGHTGFVARVAEDGRSFNTIEGNCGNRVKFGLRQMTQPGLMGFIRIFPDFVKTGWARGVLAAKSVARESQK